MKLCKDCRHCRFNWMYLQRMCRRPEYVKVSPVDGGKVTAFLDCEHERGLMGKCGPEGKYFEPKNGGWVPGMLPPTPIPKDDAAAKVKAFADAVREGKFELLKPYTEKPKRTRKKR